MNYEQLALVRGRADTVAALRRWRESPAATLRPWALGSLVIALLLLAATLIVAMLSMPEEPFGLIGAGQLGGWSDFAWILYRNGLVLALHAMACVAGFIAGSALPVVAEGHSGWRRRVHDRAGRLAIGFVVVATLFSLSTQAYGLGAAAATQASERGLSPVVLILGLAPHAVPELSALFLPLAAWILASRRGGWNELLAATVVTTAIAIPILVACAAWEVWVSPHVLYFLK